MRMEDHPLFGPKLRGSYQVICQDQNAIVACNHLELVDYA